jgi:excisionase family DNA binding protein
MDKEYLTVEDIALILNRKVHTIRQLFNYGKLKGRKIAGQWIISKEQFKNYVERNDSE